MRQPLMTMEYFETYYYANIVHNVLDDPTDYLRGLNDWYGDHEVALFLRPFQKWSLLHDLSSFIIETMMYEQLDDLAIDAVVNHLDYELWVDQALRHHGFKPEGFRSWLNRESIALADVTEDDAHAYHRDLHESGELDRLLEQLANEVFFILFGNRALLAKLNTYVAAAVGDLNPSDLPEEAKGLMAGPGLVTRASIPEWVRRAVFFRDRGMCASCGTDLSGMVTVCTDKHFDHIVPLRQGGINDVTNIQLLCGSCNLSKGCKIVGTSSRYEAWYS